MSLHIFADDPTEAFRLISQLTEAAGWFYVNGYPTVADQIKTYIHELNQMSEAIQQKGRPLMPVLEALHKYETGDWDIDAVDRAVGVLIGKSGTEAG